MRFSLVGTDASRFVLPESCDAVCSYYAQMLGEYFPLLHSESHDTKISGSCCSALVPQRSLLFFIRKFVKGLEVLFKTCKSYLNLVKEYRGISYDTMNAHVSIVFSRYMMLSVAQRENEDDKTICELCFCLLDEMEDITFSRYMRMIIDALIDTVMEYFHITETQLEEFATSFIQRLPKYMKEALEWKEVAA